jgi:hypothetical protein
MFQIPTPNTCLIDNVRQAIRRNLGAAFDPIAVDGLIHIEPNFPYAAKFFAQTGPEKTTSPRQVPTRLCYAPTLTDHLILNYGPPSTLTAAEVSIQRRISERGAAPAR